MNAAVAAPLVHARKLAQASSTIAVIAAVVLGVTAALDAAVPGLRELPGLTPGWEVWSTWAASVRLKPQRTASRTERSCWKFIAIAEKSCAMGTLQAILQGGLPIANYRFVAFK